MIEQAVIVAELVDYCSQTCEQLIHWLVLQCLNHLFKSYSSIRATADIQNQDRSNWIVSSLLKLGFSVTDQSEETKKASFIKVPSFLDHLCNQLIHWYHRSTCNNCLGGLDFTGELSGYSFH